MAVEKSFVSMRQLGRVWVFVFIEQGQQANSAATQSRFLCHFTFDGLSRRFTNITPAAWQSPAIVRSLPDK
jgi:hypothetical protein